MKNSIFIILAIISISLFSCKKDIVKPVAQPPAVKQAPVAQAVKPITTQLYDYQKAILVKRTITTN